MSTILKRRIKLNSHSITESLHGIYIEGFFSYTDLKVMKSSWLANVITRLLSSFGTGKRYLRIFDTCENTVNSFYVQTGVEKEYPRDKYSARATDHLPSCRVVTWSCEKLGGGRPQKWCLCLEHRASLPHCKVWNKLWVQTAGGTPQGHLWIYMDKR